MVWYSRYGKSGGRGKGPTSFDSIAYQALHVSLHTRQLVSCSETLSWNGCLLWQAANKMWAGPATATWCCRFWQHTIPGGPLLIIPLRCRLRPWIFQMAAHQVKELLGMELLWID